MANITVKFVNFWNGFNESDNRFVELLRTRHNVTIIPSTDPAEPDLLFFSIFGTPRHFGSRSIRIYYTGENDVPDFNVCDYAISFHPITFSDRHFRYPLYMLYNPYGVEGASCALSDDMATARGFCTALLRNTQSCDPMRISIIDTVESYKPITYGGPFRNNTGGPVADKIEFISGYKFNLALENSCVPGYVTEKIVEPFAAGTVPVYWGSEWVNNDFNPSAFINASNHASPVDLVKAISDIDNDSSRYLEMLNAPKFRPGVPGKYDEGLLEFLDNIVVNGRRHVSPYEMSGTIYAIDSLTRPAYHSVWTRRALKLLKKLSVI